MKIIIISSLKIFSFFTVLLGVIYPVLITVIAQEVFPEKANGSLLTKKGVVVGSSLLAQKTNLDQYFWPRSSASDYGTIPSGATNLGPTAKNLKNILSERRSKGMDFDMLFASGSGLDPHISLNAALIQIPRIAESRKMSKDAIDRITALTKQSVEKRDFGFLGEERINVLKLNISLDEISRAENKNE